MIEDDAGDARFIRRTLADATPAYPAVPSFDLTRARRLASGLKRLAPGKFDVVLLDLSLPDSQGLDTFIRVHAQAPQTPIVVLSDVEDRELALEAMQKGAQDCLVKGELSGNLLARAIRYAIERKRAEEALRASETRCRRLFEAAQDGILILDADTGEITDVNPFLTTLLGYPREELLGKRLWDIGPLKDVAASKAAFEELQRTGYVRYESLPPKSPRPLAGEYLNYRHDGKECWIQWVVQCISDESGQVVELQAVGRDVNARKQAEEALKRERDLGRRIKETSTDGNVMVNRE